MGTFSFGAKLSADIVLVEDKLNLKEIELSVEVNGKESKVSLSCTLFWHDKEILGSSTLQLMGKFLFMNQGPIKVGHIVLCMPMKNPTRFLEN